MPAYRFSLNIPRETYMRYYQGAVSAVIAHDDQGRRVQFPASALRAHVTADGVQGRFVMTTDEAHKLLSLERET